MNYLGILSFLEGLASNVVACVFRVSAHACKKTHTHKLSLSVILLSIWKYFLGITNLIDSARSMSTHIPPVVLYGCETWSLTLREESRLRVFENRVLRRIFGPKKDEVTGK